MKRASSEALEDDLCATCGHYHARGTTCDECGHVRRGEEDAGASARKPKTLQREQAEAATMMMEMMELEEDASASAAAKQQATEMTEMLGAEPKLQMQTT